MIVKSIYLENWKLFREAVEVDFSQGLNILYGRNESGKSTLIDSIRIVLFSKHTSQSEKIRSLVPWGSSLSPSAKIVFCQDNENYRVTKRFLSPQSLLERLVGARWERIAEGDDADRRVIELVGGRFSSKGDTKPELWGLGQALWMVQGQPFLSEDLNEETMSALQKLVGAAIESEEEKKLFAKVNEQFFRVFTDKGKGIRKGSELWSIRERIEQLEQERNSLESIEEEKERLIRDIEDEEIELQSKTRKLEAALKEKGELETQRDLAHEHETKRKTLEEEVKRISRDYQALKQHIDKIRESKQRIEGLERENEDHSRAKKVLEGNLKESAERLQLLGENLERIDELIKQKEDTRRFAGIAHTAILEEQKLQDKEQLLKRVLELEQELLEKQKAFEGLKAPTREDLKQIEDLHQQMRDIEAKLSVVGLTIRARAESGISGDVCLDEQVTKFELKGGESSVWKAYETVKMRIEGVGEFEVKSGSEDVKQMRADLESLEIAYEKAVAPYQDKEVGLLRTLVQQKEELGKDIERLKREIKKQTREGKEALIAEIAMQRKKIELNWEKIAESSEFRKYAEGWDKVAAQTELSRKINELEGELKDLKATRRLTEQELENWRRKRGEIEGEINKLELEMHGNNERLREIRSSLNDLEKDGLNLEERETKLNEISLELDRKERALRTYKDEIDELEEKPRRAYKECEQKIERLREEIGKLSSGIAKAEGRLKSILESWKDPNILEEELGYLKDKASRLEVEAEALRLLYDLAHFYRNQVIESLIEPIQSEMIRDMNVLLGTKYGSVQFDRGIKPASINVNAWKTNASLDVLSFGTQEQIWYLFRLALGKLLSSQERQLVVLDDPLANTDVSRLRRALRILEDAAEKLQIIVVTCDVDKYNWLSKAKFISLEKRLS